MIFRSVTENLIQTTESSQAAGSGGDPVSEGRGGRAGRHPPGAQVGAGGLQ